MENEPLLRQDRFPKSLDFIQDAVAEKDGLGGGHQRISTTASNVIAANSSLRVVGLLGPWGSGKSTVARLISQNLENRGDPAFQVFTYDAWLHQGDATRRSFIEALAEFVMKGAKVGTSDWRDELDRVTGRAELTRTFQFPDIRMGTWATYWAALAVPMGMMWLLKIDSLHKQFPRHSLFELVAPGVALALLPFLVALVVKGWRLFALKWEERWGRPSDKPSTEQRVVDGASGLGILLKKEAEQTIKRVLKDPTPTTIEFRMLFRKIVRASLGPKNAKESRLLIIIDNLDRLADSEAMEVWSIVRSLFLWGEEDPGANFDFKLTILLPIDEAAITRVFASNGSQIDSDAFIQKTFDLTFRLPRPLFSSWQTYLESQVKKVFGKNIKSNDMRDITRLLDIFVQENSAPTPRQINAIVNEFGVLWLQWKPEGVSMISIANYAINHRVIDANIWTAVGRQTLVARLDDDWRRSMCAMHFGVSIYEGIDVLMEEQLSSAFGEHDDNLFIGVGSLRGFHTVLRRVVGRWDSETQSIPELKVLYAIDLVSRLGDAADEQHSLIWSHLSKAYCRSAFDPSAALPFQPVLSKLIPFISPKEACDVVNSLLEHMLAAKSDSRNLNSVQIEVVQKVLYTFRREILSNKAYNGFTLSKIFVDGPLENLISIGISIGTDNFILKHISTKDRQLSTELLAQPKKQAPQSQEQADERFLAVALSGSDLSWQEYFSYTGEVLAGRINAPYATSMLALGVLRQKGLDVDVLLKQLTTPGGAVEARMRQAFVKGDDTLFARGLVLLLLADQLPMAEFAPAQREWPKQLPDLPSRFTKALRQMTPNQGASLGSLKQFEKDVPWIFQHLRGENRDGGS